MSEDQETGGVGLPLAVCAAVAAVLLALAVAGVGGSAETPSADAAPQRPATPIATVARRVEAIRGLRFREPPRPVTVTKEQAVREGTADLDRSYTRPERRADEELYKLLGLLEPDVDLREVFTSVFADQVSGYYDPRTGRLRLVQGGAATNRVLDETTVAHELDHALEDQRFGLDIEEAGTTGDRPLAYQAMVEGTATALMNEYQARHFGREEALGAAAAGALGAPSTANLPPFVTAQLLFPYLDGERWVRRLYATAGNSWRLVDIAERLRPPVSTEQVLHPEKYLSLEPPVRLSLAGVGRVLRSEPGAGWRRVTGSAFGEWQTREWLARGGGTGAPDAAAGWGGDRYELWRQGPLEARDCRAPCAARDALVMRWRWDTARDAAEFRTAVDGALEQGLGAERVGLGGWSLRGAAVQVGTRGTRETTLVFAPSFELARRLTESG